MGEVRVHVHFHSRHYGESWVMVVMMDLDVGEVQ